MKKITFIIAALNEERRIVKVIKSIKNYANEIIILDPGSTDNTIKLAMKEFEVKVINVNIDMFDIQSRMKSVIDVLENDINERYIFPMNASEFITPDLGESMINLINSDTEISGVNIYRQSYTFGCKTHNRILYFWCKSLFKKGSVRLINLSKWDHSKSRIHHELPIKKEFRSSIKTILPTGNRIIKHEREGDLSSFDLKHMNYSTQEAKELFKSGVKANLITFIKIVLPSLIFFPFQFLCSKEAGIAGLYHITYKVQVWAKLAELGIAEK